jgi:hypothetical protein
MYISIMFEYLIDGWEVAQGNSFITMCSLWYSIGDSSLIVTRHTRNQQTLKKNQKNHIKHQPCKL